MHHGGPGHPPIGRRAAVPGRRTPRLGPGLAVAGALALIGGCGTSGTANASTALATSCRQVTAILSDGPDPTADPVGYAEAQILPLATVHPTDDRLRAALTRLDAAFRVVYRSDGSSPAVHQETSAESAVDAICPGATG